jgi:hypothetical protein
MKFIFHSFNGYLFQMCQVCFNEKKMEGIFLIGILKTQWSLHFNNIINIFHWILCVEDSQTQIYLPNIKDIFCLS